MRFLISFANLKQTLSFKPKLALAIPVFFLALPLHAQNNTCESYLIRPNIFDDLHVRSQIHPDLPQPWDQLKPAHLEAVAEILEMYPTEEIYFLARDAELLYDLAKLATRDEPEQFKRLHLLNVSRANMRDSHIRNYLSQEGISPLALKGGKEILLVDTGFSGTIPAVISENFPEDLRGQLKTHLICSSNLKHPSTRVFLQHLNPSAAGADPSQFHGTIVAYEHLPRFTDRSSRFEKSNSHFGEKQKWVPMSCASTESDGSVSKEKALAYMEDLKAYSLSPEAQQKMKNLRSKWNHLMTLLRKGASKTDVKTSLKALLVDHDPHAEALVRDFLEIIHRNHRDLAEKISLNPEDLDLKDVLSSKGGNKLMLLKQYPQWKSILEDPETVLPKLIQSGNFQTLRSILDVIDDHEFMELATIEMGRKQYAEDQAKQKEIRLTIQGIMEKGNPKTLTQIGENIFSSSHTLSWKKEFKELVGRLEPVNKKLTSALLADHNYPFGDPLHARNRPMVKYVRTATDTQWVTKQSDLEKKYGEPFKRAFEKSWKDPRGVIWGNMIKKEDGADFPMSQREAQSYCESIGAHLPTQKDYTGLVNDLTTDEYVPQFLPNLNLKRSFYRVWTDNPEGDAIR